MGVFLMVGVVLSTAYFYHAARRAVIEWERNFEPVVGNDAGGLDIYWHDTYYVVASPTWIVVAIVLISAGCLMAVFPKVLIRMFSKRG